MKKEKKPKPRPEHKQRYGYTRYPDGSIKPAPYYITTFVEMGIEYRALVDLAKTTQDALNAFLQQAYGKLFRRERDLWLRVREDYDLHGDWIFDYDQETLCKSVEDKREK